MNKLARSTWKWGTNHIFRALIEFQDSGHWAKSCRTSSFPTPEKWSPCCRKVLTKQKKSCLGQLFSDQAEKACQKKKLLLLLQRQWRRGQLTWVLSLALSSLVFVFGWCRETPEKLASKNVLPYCVASSMNKTFFVCSRRRPSNYFSFSSCPWTFH